MQRVSSFYLFLKKYRVECFLFLLAAVLRAYGVWVGRFDPTSDQGIVGLMVKHIYEGRHFPLFFYGQAYMGSGEAYVSAFFVPLLGCNMSAVRAGVALLSFLLLPVIYGWTREWGGRRAACWALAFSVAGSSLYFHYMAGNGYALTLLLGTLSLWIAAHLLKKEVRHEKARMLHYALLGLACGIGWWSNYLTVVYTGAIAIFFALVLRRRLLTRGPITALVCCVAGAAPWIYVTLTETTATGLVSNITFSQVLQSARIYLGFCLDMFDLRGGRGLHAAFRIAAFLVLLITYFVVIAQRVKSRGAYWLCGLILPVVVVLLNAGLSLISGRFAHVPAPRYLLPLFPIWAFCAGISTSWLQEKTHRVVGAVPALVLLVAGSLFLLPERTETPPNESTDWRIAVTDIPELVEFTHAQGIDVLLGSYFCDWLNFASGEQLTVCTYPDWCRYIPYRAQANNATNPAVLYNFMEFEAFLNRTQSSAERTVVKHTHLTYHIQPPTDALDYLSADKVASVRLNERTIHELNDGNLDTPVSYDLLRWEEPEPTPGRLVIELKTPQMLCGAVLLGPSGSLAGPFLQSIHLVLTNGVRRPVLSEPLEGEWFWSGGRLYAGGVLNYTEFRFPECAVERIEMVMTCVGDQQPLCSEFLLLKPRPADLEPILPFDSLSVFLENEVRGKVYAPRSITEKLHDERPLIQTILPADCYEQPLGNVPSPAPYETVSLKAGDALLVWNRDATRTKHLLNRLEINPQMKKTGGLIAYYGFSGDDEKKARSAFLFWTEQGPFLGDARRIRMSDTRQEKTPAAISTHALPSNAIPAHVRYPRVGTLVGYSAAPQSANPGETVTITYYWQCPTTIHPNRYAVFVRIMNGAYTFNGDHVYMAGIPPYALTNQRPDEVFAVPVSFRIPDGAPPGNYTLSAGVYHLRSGDRLTPSTELPVSRRCVSLGPVLIVP